MIDIYLQRHGKRVYGLCLRLCANVSDAEDLYQDTWLKVVQHLDRYDPSQPFEPWITRICVNTYRNALRRLARTPLLRFHTTEEQETLLQSIPAPQQPDYTPLHQAIDSLPERLRLTVILFYFRDMDIAATAAVLNIPPGTVKSRLNQARLRLKEVLSSETDLLL